MLVTTLGLLKKANACTERYRHLCKELGGAKKYGYDTPIAFVDLVRMNGLDDALWALRAVPERQEADRDFIARIFSAYCAGHVLPIYEREYPTEKRVRMCIESACLYAYGNISTEELTAARDAAWDAARDAAWDAARAAARDAARAAARAAARDAAWDAAWDAARDAAWAAAWDAARAAAWDAETDWQKELFLSLLDSKHQAHVERANA